MSRRACSIERIAKTAPVVVLLVGLWASSAQADPLIIGNNAAFGGGPITTYDFATGGTVNSFVPDGAFGGNNGRGVAVFGGEVYYTELSNGFGATDFIRVAPFNGGAGGSDTRTLPNPRPVTGVQDLAFSRGALYVLTGYYTLPLEVFVLDPVTGAVLSGPVPIAGPARPDSDGFTVLPNGNFLINNGDASCTYNQYDPLTGALVPATTLVVPGGSFCTGVDTDGVSLYFQPDLSSFTQTDLAGNFVGNVFVGANLVEDISLIGNRPPDCAGAVADPGTLWPPNHVLVPIAVNGVTDPDGDPLTITATSVTQDEAVKDKGIGSGATSPDAGLSPLAVRAERNGNPKTPGDGRVYHVSFTADDGKGGTCDGAVSVCVPHDMRPGASCVDGGPLYNSIP